MPKVDNDFDNIFGDDNKSVNKSNQNNGNNGGAFRPSWMNNNGNDQIRRERENASKSVFTQDDNELKPQNRSSSKSKPFARLDGSYYGSSTSSKPSTSNRQANQTGKKDDLDDIFGGSGTSGNGNNGKAEEDSLDSILGVDEQEVQKEKEESIREKYIGKKIKPLSTGRIVGIVIFAIAVCVGISGTLVYLFQNQVRYPSEQVVEEADTGLYAVQQYENKIKSYKTPKDSESVKGMPYLQQEYKYANKNEDRVELIKNVINTVQYEVEDSTAYNKYGNPLIDRGSDEWHSNDDKVVVKKSKLMNGEPVKLHYMDWKAVTFDSDTVQKLMSDAGLKFGDVDYENKLINVFCQYINSMGDLPTTTTQHIPNLVHNTDAKGYYMSDKEDEYLDQLLFSSEAFHTCLDRFSEVAGGTNVKISSDWYDYMSKTDSERKDTIQPEKYGYKDTLPWTWIGAYYLTNDYYYIDSTGKKVHAALRASIGDGTLDQPAGLSTSVLTVDYEPNEKGELTAYPIKVELMEFGVSQKAIDWFETKNVQNRGFDITSNMQYAYYVFRVTNMSNRELTIDDNSSLSDGSENLSSKAGIIYGLQDKVTLKPDEQGIIESWGRSTELWRKYLIWGADFERKSPVVWFRVLAGDKEDTSTFKGVYVKDQTVKDEQQAEEENNNRTDAGAGIVSTPDASASPEATDSDTTTNNSLDDADTEDSTDASNLDNDNSDFEDNDSE